LAEFRETGHGWKHRLPTVTGIHFFIITDYVAKEIFKRKGAVFQRFH
jgi:hypothetical protein